MPPGFKPHELATRYNVERFREDEWHTYCGDKSSKIITDRLASCESRSRLLLNAGSGVYQIFPADNLPDIGSGVPRELFRAILERIGRLRLATVTSL